MIILEEVGVGLETDNIQIISEGMTEVVVGLDQVQETVLIEIELDAIAVGNMIILLRTVQFCRKKKNQSKYNKCILWMKSKQH